MSPGVRRLAGNGVPSRRIGGPIPPATRYTGGERENVTRPFAMIVGVVYAALGLIGFVVTGFDHFVSSRGDTLLGLHVNGFHNLVHLVIGLGFIVVARLPDSTIRQGVLLGGGLVYVAAALLGFLNRLPILAVHGHVDADNFLHLFSGAAAIVFALVGAAQQSEAEKVVAMPGRGGI